MSFLERIAAKNSSFSMNASVTAVFLGDSVTHGCFETFVNHRGEFDSVYDFESVYPSA